MSFPTDIKGCMKDCILSIFWPKADIYKFFVDHACEKKDLKLIEDYKKKENAFSRSAMIDIIMFDALSTRADGGLGPFRAMLQSLLKWNNFSPYYFEKIKKLDRDEAERNLNHLRQLQEIRDTKLKAERQSRESAEAQAQKARSSLAELRNEFLELHAGKLKPQQRGYALEKILAGLAKIDDLEASEPFRVIGEQIDGTLKFDGEHYLIEAKWHDTSSSNEPVYQFVGKIEGKMYGRGLFISIQGFSENVIHSVVRGKALRTIFIDGEDLILVLEEQISFVQMIDKKVKAAQTKGLIYINPISGNSKIREY